MEHRMSSIQTKTPRHAGKQENETTTTRKIIQQKQTWIAEIMELEDNEIKIAIIKIFKDLKENMMK